MSSGTPTCRARSAFRRLVSLVDEALGVDEGGRRQLFQATRLTSRGATPRTPLR